MRRLGVSMVAVSLLVAGCTSSGDASGFDCQSAPEDQLHSVAAFPLSVSENPVVGGANIDLNIGSTITLTPAQADETDRGVTGYGSTWQCWIGSEWVDTHLLVHDGATLAGEPGATTTAPAIGILIPESFRVIVPDVDPGWYRIRAGIAIPVMDGTPTSLVGYITVEVVDNLPPTDNS